MTSSSGPWTTAEHHGSDGEVDLVLVAVGKINLVQGPGDEVDLVHGHDDEVDLVHGHEVSTATATRFLDLGNGPDGRSTSGGHDDEVDLSSSDLWTRST